MRALCLNGPLASAEPKHLRYTLLHTAARVVHTARSLTLHFVGTWPWTDALVVAFGRLRSLPSR